jgi:hypothetical protein
LSGSGGWGRRARRRWRYCLDWWLSTLRKMVVIVWRADAIRGHILLRIGNVLGGGRVSWSGWIGWLGILRSSHFIGLLLGNLHVHCVIGLILFGSVVKIVHGPVGLPVVGLNLV